MTTTAQWQHNNTALLVAKLTASYTTCTGCTSRRILWSTLTSSFGVRGLSSKVRLRSGSCWFASITFVETSTGGGVSPWEQPLAFRLSMKASILASIAREGIRDMKREKKRERERERGRGRVNMVQTSDAHHHIRMYICMCRTGSMQH